MKGSCSIYVCDMAGIVADEVILCNINDYSNFKLIIVPNWNLPVNSQMNQTTR